MSFDEFDEGDWLAATHDDDLDDDDTLEFVISSDDEEESTWEWDGHDWRRVA